MQIHHNKIAARILLSCSEFLIPESTIANRELEWKQGSEVFGHEQFLSLLYSIIFFSFNRRSGMFVRISLHFPEIILQANTTLSLFECYWQHNAQLIILINVLPVFFQPFVVVLIFGKYIFHLFSLIKYYSHLFILFFQVFL